MKESLLIKERVEKKYLFSELQAMKLCGKLQNVLPEDPNNGTDCKGYIVRSLYFDTLGDVDFYDKEDGVERRRKIRLRCYPPNFSNFKLELKEKRGSYQRKRSIPLSRLEAEQLATGDYALLQDKGDLAVQLYIIMLTEMYIPRCVVEYSRIAFAVPENDTRITFDRGLRASEDAVSFFGPSASLYPVFYRDNVILEVKYRALLLSYIKELMSDYCKIQTSASKYYLARGIGHLISL